ncbi:MAG: hypothetical protein HQL64_05005 [Magnetococcales bacterium]|nr:hypothetical protein [Magnetococcales bacterium]
MKRLGKGNSNTRANHIQTMDGAIFWKTPTGKAGHRVPEWTQFDCLKGNVNLLWPRAIAFKLRLLWDTSFFLFGKKVGMKDFIGASPQTPQGLCP